MYERGCVHWIASVAEKQWHTKTYIERTAFTPVPKRVCQQHSARFLQALEEVEVYGGPAYIDNRTWLQHQCKSKTVQGDRRIVISANSTRKIIRMEKRWLWFRHHTLTNSIHNRLETEMRIPNLQSFWEKKGENP